MIFRAHSHHPKKIFITQRPFWAKKYIYHATRSSALIRLRRRPKFFRPRLGWLTSPRRAPPPSSSNPPLYLQCSLSPTSFFLCHYYSLSTLQVLHIHINTLQNIPLFPIIIILTVCTRLLSEVQKSVNNIFFSRSLSETSDCDSKGMLK